MTDLVVSCGPLARAARSPSARKPPHPSSIPSSLPFPFPHPFSVRASERWCSRCLDDVAWRRILGVLVDNCLQFDQLLVEPVSRRRSNFERVFCAADTVGLGSNLQFCMRFPLLSCSRKLSTLSIGCSLRGLAFYWDVKRDHTLSGPCSLHKQGGRFV